MEECRQGGAARWVGHLIRLCKNLAEENAELRERNSRLKQAHASHLSRLDELQERVDGLISRAES